MTDKFKLILKTFVDFNEKEIDYVVSFFKPKTVKKIVSYFTKEIFAESFTSKTRVVFEQYL
jgi:hypothetical protein